MWVEIIPKDEVKTARPKKDISPKPPAEYEMRFIVWECKGVPRVNHFTDTVDIFISAKTDDGHEFKTDTHFASKNGKGSFNWRMVIPQKYP